MTDDELDALLQSVRADEVRKWRESNGRYALEASDAYAQIDRLRAKHDLEIESLTRSLSTMQKEYADFVRGTPFAKLQKRLEELHIENGKFRQATGCSGLMTYEEADRLRESNGKYALEASEAYTRLRYERGKYHALEQEHESLREWIRENFARPLYVPVGDGSAQCCFAEKFSNLMRLLKLGISLVFGRAPSEHASRSVKHETHR